MPIYVYEARDAKRACGRCCPDCGAPVFRVIQAPGLGRSQTDLNYRAKRAGFHSLKRVGRGEYEKMY